MSRFLYLYAGMTVLAAVLARLTGCPSLFRVPADPVELWGSLAAAALLAAFVVQGGKALERLPWYREMAKLLKRMLTSPDMLGPHLDGGKALVIAVYSGVGEEALFRGWLQPWLIGAFNGWFGGGGEPSVLITALGVLAASLIFGLLHFPVVPELRPWTAFAVGAGLAFGALAAWSGSLLAPLLAHFLINWLNLKRLADFPLDGP